MRIVASSKRDRICHRFSFLAKSAVVALWVLTQRAGTPPGRSCLASLRTMCWSTASRETLFQRLMCTALSLRKGDIKASGGRPSHQGKEGNN